MSIKDAATAILKEESDGDELTPEEKASLDEKVSDEDYDGDEPRIVTLDSAVEPPVWAIIPEKFKFPKGKTVYFMRFMADMTDTPNGGDRQCILWNLSMADEDIGLKRTRGDHMRVNRELAMMMIRAVDGHAADWTGAGSRSPGSVRHWMDLIGAKCRQEVQNLYLRTHGLAPEERARFFVDCFAFMNSV